MFPIIQSIGESVKRDAKNDSLNVRVVTQKKGQHVRLWSVEVIKVIKVMECSRGTQQVTDVRPVQNISDRAAWIRAAPGLSSMILVRPGNTDNF